MGHNILCVLVSHFYVSLQTAVNLNYKLITLLYNVLARLNAQELFQLDRFSLPSLNAANYKS